MELAMVVEVGVLVVIDLQLRIVKLRLDGLGSGRNRRQVGVALRQLRLEGRQRFAQIALLTLECGEPLLLTRLLLLNPRQSFRERARVVRARRHRGYQEQQRREGARCLTDYSGGAPAEPGMPGSRGGVKVVPLNGAGAPLGGFSFFFFFASRFPLSRDFAMVPASRLSPASRYCSRDGPGCLCRLAHSVLRAGLGNYRSTMGPRTRSASRGSQR